MAGISVPGCRIVNRRRKLRIRKMACKMKITLCDFKHSAQLNISLVSNLFYKI